ncbi:MAG: hypothetical protein P4M00_13560 [Azospirillaceae bacterium]|nr:hypothetical protein [Azospirillaceae bacterium]
MDESLWALAETLAGAPLTDLVPLTGGANNRLFRIADRRGRIFALKVYRRMAHDPRDRLAIEFGALSFLRQRAVTVVPEPVAIDAERGVALYQWVEGDPVTKPGATDIDAVLRFADQLREMGTHEGAAVLPAASEACLSALEIVEQIDRRYHRLAEVAERNPILAEFLIEPFSETRTRAVAVARDGYAARKWDFSAALPRPLQVLSPSDFGFHNTLRRPDGSLVFLDFEYFGWDDPVRLVADFLQHPAMRLEEDLSDRFVAGARGLYGADPGFLERLDLLFPLIGLRWCLILLNEFLPERWAARQFAGMSDDRPVVLERQLAKARRRLTAVVRTLPEWGRR